MKPVIFYDSTRCLGCRSCELACAVVHSEAGELERAINEKPLPEHRVRLEDAQGSPVPILCKHCESAPCVEVCPTEAIKKSSDGPVVVDSGLCVGCSSCVIVCPWGVPRMGRDGKVMIKCDMCIERLKKGEQPACVGACPTKALRFGEIEEMAQARAEKQEL